MSRIAMRRRSFAQLLSRRMSYWETIKGKVGDMMSQVVVEVPDTPRLPLPGLLKDWKGYYDKDIGGQSFCTVTKEASGVVRFSGRLVYDEVQAAKLPRKAKGGYCAIIALAKSQVDLRNYQGFELHIKSVKGSETLTLNSTYDTFTDGDMYQIDMEMTAGKQCVFHIPFSLMSLTALEGGAMEYQRMNDSLQLESLGLLLRSYADCDREFEFELGDIIALQQLDAQKLFDQTKAPEKDKPRRTLPS